MDIGHCLKMQLSDIKGVGCENYRNLKIAKGWDEHEFEQLLQKSVLPCRHPFYWQVGLLGRLEAV